jgi:polyvinyl alcohol dehydrogenase (cytochrome)
MRFVVSTSVVVVLVLLTSLAPSAIAAPAGRNCNPNSPFCGVWPSAGQNISNTHSQPFEVSINAGNVSHLTTQWTFTTNANASNFVAGARDVSATPTVVDDTVYFPDWGGWLYAVDAHNGKALWSRKISDYTGVQGSLSRTSPAIVNDLLIIGDKPPSGTTGWGQGSGVGAHLIAVNRHTGNLAWITQVDNTFVSQMTGSPVVLNGVVYSGVSSEEEVTAAFVPNYQCCIFRGSVVALDVHNGRMLWKTYDMPDGYTGGAIWGSTPAIDPQRGEIYVGTGNNYSVPPSVQTCQDNGGTNCTSPNDHFDALMALDLRTGAVKWAMGTIAFDNWTVGCILSNLPNCPAPSSPDADFGSGPNRFDAETPNGPVALVGAGTKGGTYWALDANTGKVVWATQVGPGGVFGGIEWGSSVADGHVYVAEANSANKPITLTNPSPGSATSTTGGAWLALDASTGKIIWETADPAGPTFGDIGQTATANGVVYAGSSDKAGHVFAMDAGTGAIKWSFATGGSIGSGASIVDGTVYWGSGYTQFKNSGTTGNDKVFAFSLPR